MQNGRSCHPQDPQITLFQVPLQPELFESLVSTVDARISAGLAGLVFKQVFE